MKKNKLLRAMSLVDDKFIDEADPTCIIKKNKTVRKRKLVIALAATLAVLTSLSLWLFIPLKDANADITQYADSEYYEIIQKIHPLTYVAPRYKNNFEKYVKRGFLNIFGAKAESSIELEDGSAFESITITSGTQDPSSYQEVTDNQVEGVIEADLIKRTNTHIFYLDGLTLRAFSIEGENSREVGSYKIKNGSSSWNAEFYLSLDGKSATVILPHTSSNKTFVSIERVDVSDPTNMKAERGFCVSGHLESTRMTNGELIILTNFYAKSDFSDPESFIPSIGETYGKMEALPLESLYVPNDVTNASYTVITRLDANTLEHKDSYSILSYSSGTYVSEDTIYTWRRTRYDTIDIGNDLQKQAETSEIVGISYNEPTMRFLGSVKIDGYIKDQYSLDQYNGILRVVTTIEESIGKEHRYMDTISMELYERTVSASLYCIDLSTWQTVASVEKFAPKDETVRSVRFDGNSAYVCTAVQSTDPVFFFDLTDINNITYTDTGTISGFSTSLVDFGDGYLLGIGEDEDGYLKIEIYEEVDGKVVSVCKYTPPKTSYSGYYKSYYIDRKNGLIGLGTNVYSLKNKEYTVLSFADRSLTEEIRVELSGSAYTNRGVYVDGYFYMFGENDFKVEKLDIES